MEEKQLKFDQPLLSVRRFTSGGAISENDSKRKTDKSRRTVPRPPPYKSELKSGPIRNPGTVPFLWEQTPGRPKDETNPRNHIAVRPPTAPKLPPGKMLNARQEDLDKASVNQGVSKNPAGSISHGSENIPSVNEDVKRSGTSIEGKEEVENSSSEDADEQYVDALDTLSRTESFFINCSLSGLSGLDDQDINISERSLKDPQTRDFMMGRFLPAAKAMASETPHHAPWKPPVVKEQPRQLKKFVNGDKQPQLRYGLNFVPDFSHENGDAESDDDYDAQEIFHGKVCGLLPRLGLRSSFCFLNPLPGMSVRTREPVFPYSKRQATSSSSGSCSEPDNEQYKHVMSEQRSLGSSPTTKLQLNQDVSNNDDGVPSSHQRNNKSGPLSECNGALQSYECQAAISINGESKNSDGFGSEPEKIVSQSLEELLAEKSTSNELDKESPMVEKTLYVDTVHKVEPVNSKSCSSNTEGKESGTLTERIEQYQTIDSYLKDIESLSIVDKGDKSQPKYQKPVDFHVKYSRDKAYQNMKTLSIKPLDQCRELYKDAIVSANQMVPHTHQKASPKPEFLVPPPLPKSPTDSWLGRTLPSVSKKNASTHSYLGKGGSPRFEASEPKLSNPKWETIVKTSKTQQEHMRFSEERLTPIPEA